MQSTDCHNATTTALVIWGLLSPLFAVWFGSITTRSSEQKQWRRNREQEEFRELVTGLVAAIMEQQKFIALSKPGDPASQMFEAQYATLQIIADRIFIRKSLKPLKVDEVYIDANTQFTNDRDYEKFSARMDVLIHDIVTLAEKL